MKRSFNALAGIILSGLLTSTCSYEFPESPYPRVETLSAINISSTGVTLQGSITQLGETSIMDHGFVWGPTPLLTIESEEKVQLGSASTTGSFSAAVTSGLYADSTYYVKAYVVTESFFVYGKAVAFTSLGSTPPVISELIPSEGTLGDTIVIKGSEFSTKITNNQVRFGNILSSIVASTSTEITCVVPTGIANATPVFVTVAGRVTQSAQNFIVLPPVVTSFSPTSGNFLDIVTLVGDNFSPILTSNQVKFCNEVAEVVAASKNEIKVKVPPTLMDGECLISITINNQTGQTNSKFTVLPPTVSSLSSNEGFIGETLQITGNNFNPTISGNHVRFGELEAIVVSANFNRLIVTIPEGIYKSRSFKIEVVVAGQSAYSTQDFTLLDPWIRKADLPEGDLPPTGPRRYGAVAFAIGDYGYAGLGGDGVDNSFYRYDPSQNTWTEIAPYPGGPTGYAISFVIDGKAYVGLGIDADPYIGSGDIHHDLWRYDPQLDEWERMADFPELPLNITYGFGYTVNGKGYIVSSEWGDNFWEFNPLSNAWNQKPDLEFTPRYFQDAGFTIENRLFVTRTSDGNQPCEFWEFNFDSNVWQQRTSFIDDSYRFLSGVGFSIGSLGYIIATADNYGMHRYDYNSDSWVRVSSFNQMGRSNPIIFVINGKAYFGAGNSLSDVWEYDPDYDVN